MTVRELDFVFTIIFPLKSEQVVKHKSSNRVTEEDKLKMRAFSFVGEKGGGGSEGMHGQEETRNEITEERQGNSWCGKPQSGSVKFQKYFSNYYICLF